MSDHATEGQDAPPLPRNAAMARRLLQSFGLIVGVILLTWAIRLSMSDDNARSLAAMRAAPASELIALFALTFASLILNGLMFWIALRPVHKLNPIDTIFTNAIATFLSILPFKLSLVTRVLIHNRRDGLRLRILIGWVAAVGALAISILAPLVIAGLWRKQLDTLWWITALLGIAFGCVAAIALGRLSNTRPWLRALSLGSYLIVQHPSAVVGHAAFRIMDVAVLAGRFLVASAIIDRAMPLDQAILLSTTYFLLSVLTPAGTLGFREMGVAAVGISQGLDQSAVALIALVVTGAEVITSAGLALIGAARIRPDRLLMRRPVPIPPTSSPAPTHPPAASSGSTGPA